MSGEQARLMASNFAEISLSYPQIEKLDDNVLASQYIRIPAVYYSLAPVFVFLPAPFS